MQEAQFLLQGDIHNGVFHTKQVDSTFIAKLMQYSEKFHPVLTPESRERLEDVKSEEELKGDFKLTLDFKKAHEKQQVTEKDILAFIQFVNGYTSDVTSMAASYNKFSDFALLKHLLTRLELANLLDLASLSKEVCSRFPLLLLIDIGGSIMCRTAEKLNFGEDGKVGKERKERRPDFTIRKHVHYFRPYMHSFLQELLEHPRVNLGFYTSIQRKNAMPLLYNVMNNAQLKALQPRVFQLYDQEFCKADELGENSWSTKRDLSRVWADEKCQSKKFGPLNTILVDSEAIKVRDYLDISIIIKPYTEDEVVENTGDHEGILKAVKEFVLELAENADEVPEYMKLHAPSFDDRETQMPDVRKKMQDHKEAIEKQKQKNEDLANKMGEMSLKEK